MFKIIFASTVLIGMTSIAAAQKTKDSFPQVAENEIVRIEAIKIATPLRLDGRLDETAWTKVTPSPKFVDLITGKPTAYATTVKLLWDDENLYVGYEVEEPNVQARFTERDSLIYQENDVELFIAGQDAYYEFETNARGTIYEGLFVWKSNYETSGLSKVNELDITRSDVRWQNFDGVGFTKHPRGPRLAFLGWDFPKIQVHTHVNGSLNDDSDTDQGWTVELALPWEGMRLLNMSEPVDLPPKPEQVWRMDFSRFNKTKIDHQGNTDSGGWALSHHGVWDSHIPECFPFVTFKGLSK